MTGPLTLPDGWTLVIHETLDSTNAEALRRIAAGEGGGLAVLARDQTAGRGSRGRRWESAQGNLHLSLTVDPPAGRSPGQLALLAGVAVAEAVEQAVLNRVSISLKWPNDLLLADGKLAGLLIEGAADAGSATLAIGIGANLAFLPVVTDGALPAVCLSHLGYHTRPEEVAVACCARVTHWLGVWAADGFGPVRTAWLARAAGLGEALSVTLPDGTRRDGVFRDIDGQGALVLQTGDGKRHRIAAGAAFFPAN